MRTQVLKFTPAQQDILNIVSCLQSEQDLYDLKKVLIQFLNERMQREMDKLWDSGDWSNEKLEKIKAEHLRTVYK